MGTEILSFGIIETEKKKCYHYKSLDFLEDVDIEKCLVSNKISSPNKKYKYFIGYLYDDHNVKPLRIMLPKTSVYVKSYDGQTQRMYFLIENNDLLEKYNAIWDKISADIKENLIVRLFLKTKIKSRGDEATDFCDKEIPKVGSNI